MQKTKKHILILLLIMLMNSCAKNPVSGMPDFVTITETQEIEMGAAYHREIIKNAKILQNEEVNKYLSDLGIMIAKTSHRPNLNWKFTIIDDPTFNAFATPGGYVYMYRGMLVHFNSEAELAGVLSHEIAHITARHAVRGMSAAQITNLLIGLAQSQVPGAGGITNSGFSLLNQLSNRAYSRKYEAEADDIAKEYLGRNSYNQDAMSDFLKTMRNADELEKEIAKKEGRPARTGYHNIFSTHPTTESRIDAMNETESRKGIDKREEFLKMIDGLPYGTSAEEGYVRNNIFYHPFFAIKFEFPENWRLDNFSEKLVISKNNIEITMISKNLLRDDIDNGLSPKRYLDLNIDETSFLSKNTLISEKVFEDNLLGHTYLYQNESINENEYIRYTVFFDTDDKKKKPKAWIFISKFKDMGNDKESDIIFNSFKKMNEQEIANSQGLKIKVIRFKDGMTYKSLADNSPLGRHAEGKLKLLNGHYPNDEPLVGSLIKIVE